MLLGPDGSIERLLPAAPAIGLFEEWRCAIADVDLEPGDTLVMFTDGVEERVKG